ncbi:MAG: carbon-nitrogen hydrolase [Pseudomonadales bacterium]|jgi:deaminated glutathione amidase|uniref:carbon-nitrogen hydrolase family protein n=1 Tax=unclassified Ketobacter TaxID=2639109 RepID=UPI000C3682B5|nr:MULTISPECIES: carbon-nitrogen hydrolase family protein [unclassified Ketobacter]MAA60145.1 carbon-nitrogen hydrolase [Pseudomonadales bacterium]MEC8811125.1 carbon-nitrogen hydrolase family protein [Pseudomonadota bacterium]TNC88629.1 MAG: carbon-nitrogen hydrolase [Alcanivorax sp.]HAG92705.1 carbon-nitrogen hydrolase [Gammaproteobacteria bacterium]MAQ25411.1 carbon-nitrogen hydrolase [Pseudomonadales bacterium]|tara:strand:+ start:9764 stop:10612 length:849 start_codon:yes stop_codon:yes gene_type:complete
MSLIRVAALQMVSNYDVDANLRVAEALLQQASEQGALLAVLPENFAVLDSDNLMRWGEEERASGVFSGFLSAQAQRLGMEIVGGTIPLRQRRDGSPVSENRVRAASLHFAADGRVLARYDKIHLFDVSVEDQQGQYLESRIIEPGTQWQTSVSAAGTLGLSVCYDLRFPELYQRLSGAGATLFSVPSAFTYRTGEAHWEPLLRARAIENQAFVIAPNQGGQHSEKRSTWGHSMIVDPWGSVLSCRESGPGLVLADLDLDWQQEIRQAMPIQQHKRFDKAELI